MENKAEQISDEDKSSNYSGSVATQPVPEIDDIDSEAPLS